MKIILLEACSRMKYVCQPGLLSWTKLVIAGLIPGFGHAPGSAFAADSMNLFSYKEIAVRASFHPLTWLRYIPLSSFIVLFYWKKYQAIFKLRKISLGVPGKPLGIVWSNDLFKYRDEISFNMKGDIKKYEICNECNYYLYPNCRHL